MTNKIKIIICSIVAVIGLLAPLAVTESSMAAPGDYYYNWDNPNCSGDIIICTIMLVYNWLSVGVLIAVVIGIILGAIQYSTAQGNAEQAKKAMTQIKNAFLALILYFVMWALLNFLVPGGLFTDDGTPKTSNVKESHYVG